MTGRRDSVLVSSGFKNFHMMATASEANRRNRLSGLICGLYPKKSLVNLIGPGFSRISVKLRKFAGRRVKVDDELIHTAVIPEIVFEAGLYLERLSWLARAGIFIQCFAMTAYSWFAQAIVRRTEFGGIYHYRAGFGLASVHEAKARGMVALCDHSIVHPLLLDTLLGEEGRLASAPVQRNTRGIWRAVLSDIEQAEYVLVNSDFVKKTFERAGYDCSRVFVAYQGLDNAFLEGVPERRFAESSSPVRFLFAGNFGERKGARHLLKALQRMPSGGWSMKLAGSIEPALVDEIRQLERSMPVRHLGNLDRIALARLMSETDVFVFPTLAEGSARVIFEAMGCGCFIITTENAGSVVEDGVHGMLIPPGDAVALSDAMIATLSIVGLGAAGRENARFIREVYGQDAYGRQVDAIYTNILADKPANRASCQAP